MNEPEVQNDKQEVQFRKTNLRLEVFTAVTFIKC
jgi:hypothetical protein